MGWVVAEGLVEMVKPAELVALVGLEELQRPLTPLTQCFLVYLSATP